MNQVSKPGYDNAAQRSFSRWWSLLLQLTQRDIEQRYRGAGLGLFWTVLTPLLMLAVYTLIFGTIFKSRWAGSDAHATPIEFAVILFSGLILFQVFSDVVVRAPQIIIQNANLVKRVQFPLEMLVPVAVLSALFHAAMSLLVLLPMIFAVFGKVNATLIFLPFVVMPLALMTLGIGWFLASLGTFLRDIGQITATIVTALMFLAPIFFPLSALPEWIQPFIVFNPLTIPVEQLRKILIFGVPPDFVALGTYTAVAALVAWLGFSWFQKTRKGFADVL